MRLREHWYIACEARRLRRRPLARTLLGEPLVLFRAAGGRPAALLDRCAHRNLALSRGRVRDACLECAYHGWRYAADGRCAAIPSLPEPAEVPGRIGVASYPAVESDGYVWVYVGERAATAAPPRFPHKGEPGFCTFTMANRFRASAFACLENFLDCPHTAFVHRGLFRSAASKRVRARVGTSPAGVTVEFDEEPEKDSVVSRLLFPKGRRLAHTDRFLLPTTSRVDYRFGDDRHFIITSQCTPVSDHETDVYTVVTFRFGRIAPLVRLVFEPLSRRIIRQDLDVLAAQTRNLERFSGARFTSVASDLIGPHILRLWREAVDGRPEERSGRPEQESEVVLRF
jgi:phenylpropionate dioxygenase-like ring-hydroxylating dioxygenase large terminal subunit